jgi:hypothetical protein
VSKVREDGITMAADAFYSVDDARPTGPSKKEAWQPARKVGTTFSWLGIQDAARKRRDSSQQPGAWAGAVVVATGEGVYLLVSQEKWDKVKVLLTEVINMWEMSKNNMSRKRLEQIRFFFNYVCQTYRFMTPYLIGFHMTIDSWRLNRNSEGWRFLPQHVRRAEESGDWEEHVSGPEGPAEVKAVPRLRQDLEALQALTQGAQPPLRRVRGLATGCTYYGFGDASGSAFGATIQIGDEVEYEYGQWSLEVVEEETSNWKELANLFRALYRVVKERGLQETEIFIFTDNSTAEGAFWKGTSKSRRLFELVLELKQLEMEADLLLHIIHVSGRRMIVQGTDGLSRADHPRGVMSGR